MHRTASQRGRACLASVAVPAWLASVPARTDPLHLRAGDTSGRAPVQALTLRGYAGMV